MLTMEPGKNSNHRICPYLGQRSDPETALSYPSELNCCFHAKPVAAIKVGHQEDFCLTNGYSNCSVYASEVGIPLPPSLHSSSGRRLQNRRDNNRKWVWGIIVLIALGFVIAWFLLTREGSFGHSSQVPTGTTAVLPEITITFPSPTNLPTSTSIIVSTPSVRPLLALETPLGIDHKFLIHQVQPGDSLDLIAGRNGTTVEALRALNYRLPSPLIPGPGWAIVVPLNFVDTKGLPAFEVYSVTEEISLKDLAAKLSVDLDQFKYYNALDDNFIPRAGDWLLVPRTALATPTP